METVFSVVNVVKIGAIGTVAFFVAFFLTPIWTKVLFKYRLGKQIRRANGNAPIFESLHAKKEGTPTMGGVLIWFSVILLVFIFWLLAKIFPESQIAKFNFLSRGQTLLPLGVLIVSAVLGIIDDLLGILGTGEKHRGLKMKERLLLFTLVAIGGAWWFFFKLDWHSINIPFLGDFNVGLFYIPIFIFMIVATAFSANETDGLDGLAGGVFLTMFAAYGAIAFVQQRMDLVTFIAAICGALIAFLWHNIHPAKFFMGDTGSMSLGVTLGVIAMLTNSSLLLPIIGIIFLIESGSVIIQVISKKIRGKKIFISSPIHHHFEAKGWPETKVTMRFWIISAISAIIGLIIFLVDSKIPPLIK